MITINKRKQVPFHLHAQLYILSYRDSRNIVEPRLFLKILGEISPYVNTTLNHYFGIMIRNHTEK